RRAHHADGIVHQQRRERSRDEYEHREKRAGTMRAAQRDPGDPAKDSCARHHAGDHHHAEQQGERVPPDRLPVDLCRREDADLGTEQGCVDAVRAAREKLGEVNLLVHSAGIYNGGAIARIQSATLEEMFRVNVFSAFYLVRDLLPAGLKNVVFIGSTAGQRGEPGHAHYAASKGALQSMMMSIAVELAPQVRVNLVSPGWVRTPMAEESLQRIGPALVPT